MSKSNYDQVLIDKSTLDQQLGIERKVRQQCEQASEGLSERTQQLEQQNQNLRNTNQLLVNKNAVLSNELISNRGASLQAKKEIAEKQKAMEYASQTYDDLVRSLKSEVEDGKVTIQAMKEELKVSLVERIVFPAGAVELNEAGKQVLNKVAGILKRVKNRRIQVEGHSDNSAVTANMKQAFPTNWEISARRATEVVRYLEEKGVNPAQMAAVALSHYHPIADNKTVQGRQTNRRIEIVLTPTVQVETVESKP